MDLRDGLVALSLLSLVLILVNGFFLARCNLEGDYLATDRVEALVSQAAKSYGGTGPGLLFKGKEGLPLPLDLNGATEEELDLLPGIGPKTALSIIEARYECGFFLTRDELVKPYGPLAPSNYWAILPYVK